MSKSDYVFMWLFSVAFLILILGVREDKKANALNEQIVRYESAKKEAAINTNIALRLMSKSVWYIVDTKTVSSKPNGKGEIVKFAGDDQLRGKLYDNRSYIKHPDFNRKVHFGITASGKIYGTVYGIAGGLLQYDYVD